MRFTTVALALTGLVACNCTPGTDPQTGGDTNQGANSQGGNGQGGSTGSFQAGGSGGNAA